MEAFESSITFHHILSQPFPNNDTHGSAIVSFRVFSPHGEWTGVNCFSWEYSKNSVCVDLFCVATSWCDPVLCVMSAQSRLVTHLCVKFIPNLEGVVRSCDLACVLAIPWHWASLAHSTAFIFEPTLIRLLIWFSLSWWFPNQLCHLPFLILLKLSHHILLRLFTHRLTILILRPMSFVQLFVLPTLELSSLKHQIQDIQSFQNHTLPWKRLSNFFLKQIITILVINFVFLLRFLLLLFLRLFLWPTQCLLWAMSVTNTLTAMCGRVDCLRQGLMLCWLQLTGKQRW